MKTCNSNRLQQLIELFSEYGKTENNGVTRLSLSDEDIAARKKFQELCEEIELTVTYDDMGNMYATLAGKQNLPPIVIGSHLDSVIKGGRFDGVLGVLTALEAVYTIKEENIELDYPITIVNFTNEEGARFEPSLMASGVLSGKFDKTKMIASTDKNGIPFAQALNESGFEGLKENRLKEASAYIELHIEQGPVLERKNLDIGVVEGVLGMVCYEISVYGESNHAGTTPISMRKDPMFTTANMIADMQKQLQRLDSDLVYTIGRMNAYPNIHTVIPSEVTFTLEARHRDPGVIAEVTRMVEELPGNINGCSIKSTRLWDRDTVDFNEGVVNAVEYACKELGYKENRMYSGAGHDAQFIASYIPSAMIFVPSVNGYSHREDELTSYKDCAKGANVLLNAVLKLCLEKVSK
ncbi:Zn-dependent hydrolase [Pseudoneobacillus rhizosphaerae]|jgi:beta-ureidopropionase / N-carbamoyl-L-amino-acid hydrolase|uniref:N-carbamoyl-L-amino-acid hydrolase n=1 Tax=Pseudoneobacillus rhizosphaerae TaxID=2880968 RepID=A0A9C7GE67_9BACI|nr:Zn-dependent hydrolase [Pseudoneobacillus rhizosphaerae]CAG9610718.1 N-carbamoyl-L-amino-acid hydrolase [Pseudoneobacillus rhizosphaerae]